MTFEFLGAPAVAGTLGKMAHRTGLLGFYVRGMTDRMGPKKMRVYET